MCRQLHLPLQSGSNKILKLMGRKYTTKQFETLVEKARGISPNIAITSDILVGFPGETERDHQETMEIIKKIGFAAGHVFAFSPRPGTGAEILPNQIPTVNKKERSREVRELFSNLTVQYHSKFIGKIAKVLWEQADQQVEGDYLLEGWTDNYIKVFTRNAKNLHNEISLVKLVEARADRMFGEIYE